MSFQVNNPWQFSSKRLDVETNLTYFGRRYYDPKLGRWLTPDPKGFIDGLNLYALVSNDPLTQFRSIMDKKNLWFAYVSNNFLINHLV